MKWISVKERLPEHNQKVVALGTLNRSKEYGEDITDIFVVTYTRTQQMIRNGKIFNNWTFPTMTYGNMIHSVTHWMPLPPLPLPNDFCSTCELEISKSISLGKEYDAFNCCGNKVCKSSQSLHECRCVGE